MIHEPHVTDGDLEVTADELVNGRLYVLVDQPGGGSHLKHIPRSDDELPRIRITEEALEAAKTLCRGMRKMMGGYRPDLTLAVSALVLHVASRPEAPNIVRDFAIAKFQAAQAEGAPHDLATPTGDEEERDH